MWNLIQHQKPARLEQEEDIGKTGGRHEEDMGKTGGTHRKTWGRHEENRRKTSDKPETSNVTRFNKIATQSTDPRWHEDKEIIGL